MNPKQQAIVESFGRGIAVVAGAGCGKTTTLVTKCRELLARNPSARFCAVSFTEKSVRDLREALTRNLPGADLSAHWVKTIHGLCATIIAEFPLQAGLQGGEAILIEDEAALLWSRSLEILWTSTDNPDITAALGRLLDLYSRDAIENLLQKLRSLQSFGVGEFIVQSFHREEVRDLWRVFESVHQRYRQSKSRNGSLDFNDLEVLAAKALADPAVQSYFHGRFDLVMVDEFQDTNPLQGAILESFVRPGFTNLCIVGDPKQSIYRFRDADVSVFRDLTERLPERHLLDQNYRSRPGIIDFVNTVCAPVFEASGLSYEPLVAGRTPQDDPAIQDATPGVSRLAWENESDLAEYLAREREKGIDLSEFVILARSVRSPKVQAFLDALSDRRIPVLFASGGRYYEDPRVGELVAFLKGWISTQNTLSQAAALRSPWIGMSDDWLYTTGRSCEQGLFHAFFESTEHPVARALRPLYLSRERVASLRPGQVLARLLELDALREELYTPMAMLWHKCEELSRQGRHFEEVVGALSDAIENEKIEKEIPAPAERGMVRVMTIHGSKGLQFPRVILLDFEGPSRNSSRSGDLIWDRRLGVHLQNRDESGKLLKEDPENEKWKHLERAAAVAESKRLFYVALTRAQEKLILVWKKDVKVPEKAKEPDYNPFAFDDWRAWVEATGLPAELGIHSSPDPALEDGPADQLSFLDSLGPAPARATPSRPVIRDFDPGLYRARHSPSEWLILDQCRLRYHHKFGEVEALPEEESRKRTIAGLALDPERGEPSGRSSRFVAEKGERIHLAIERGDDEALMREFSDETVGRAIAKKLRGALREGEGIEAFRELGFEVPLGGNSALVGMMDRLEVDRERRQLRIIDYKYTARVEPPETLLRHYALQLKLYAFAAVRLAGFQPDRIEGVLAHFTDASLTVIQAPEEWFDLSGLEAEVRRLHDQARANDLSATVGEWCRYCEISDRCSALNSSMNSSMNSPMS